MKFEYNREEANAKRNILKATEETGIWNSGVQVPVGARFFSSPRHPDQFWGPPSLLSNG
jgi:hypothetical protein